MLKSELFYIQKFASSNKLKREIKQYLNYYNSARIKSNVNKMSPIQYRAHYCQNFGGSPIRLGLFFG
ncbi:IS3 family transposase [Flavobacterium sp. DSR2-3-3]|uniref:IS3 family transposase n=1 Tax=Flavobacterium sp. DSR2-3-3 TaxID=2804632 RepID=UPI003CF4710C